MEEKRYEETGNNYRFFLGWRHASLVGILVVLYGVASLCIAAYENARPLVWVIPIAASPVGIIFWLIDKRTRDLYHAAIAAGKELEGETGGFFTRLQAEVALPPNTSPFSKLSQTGILNATFIGSSILLVVAGFTLRCL